MYRIISDNLWVMGRACCTQSKVLRHSQSNAETPLPISKKSMKSSLAHFALLASTAACFSQVETKPESDVTEAPEDKRVALAGFDPIHQSPNSIKSAVYADTEVIKARQFQLTSFFIPDHCSPDTSLNTLPLEGGKPRVARG